MTLTRQVELECDENVEFPPCCLQIYDQSGDHNISLSAMLNINGLSKNDLTMEIFKRHSITGLLFLLSGAELAWKTMVKPPVSLTMVQAEFLAASDCGSIALFLRSVMQELGFEYLDATIYEDIRECLLVADSSSPTRQMRHLKIPDFALQHWTKRDLIKLVPGIVCTYCCISYSTKNDDTILTSLFFPFH